MVNVGGDTKYFYHRRSSPTWAKGSRPLGGSVMIYAVLSNPDFVLKCTVRNQNRDFINRGRGGGGHHFIKFFIKFCYL